MPKRTYITREEKALPGHKPMKDRFTLLLCGNASGDCKVKPLLIYHSETPRPLKANHVNKETLPVMWRSNKKAWLTREFFTEWVYEAFAPCVKKYLEENNLPKQCLLLMDNASAHPKALEEDLVGEYDFITIKFLPPNTTPLLQPMDQQVISNFKKLYVKSLFRRCFEVTNDTALTLRDFWKHHFNILHSINLVDKAWTQVSYRALNSAWRKLWPECIAERDFEGFDVGAGFSEEEEEEEDVAEKPENDADIQDILSLGHNMGLEMDEDDIHELIQEQVSDLTTEELIHLQNEQKQPARVEEEHSEEEGKVEAPTVELKEICAKWDDIQAFVAKWHPDKATTSRQADMFDYNVMWHFRQTLNKKKKQVSLDRYFNKRKEHPVEEASEALFT